MDFYWSFLLTSAGEGGRVSARFMIVSWHVPMFVWDIEMIWEGNPVLPGAGRCHECYWDLLIVTIDNCQWGQWSGEGLPAWCPHVVVWHVTQCYTSSGPGSGSHYPATLLCNECPAACCLDSNADVCWKAWEWGRGGRVVSNSGSQAHVGWGVCLLTD